MRKLLQLIAAIALLNVWGSLALADDPALSAQPDVRPGAEGEATAPTPSGTGNESANGQQNEAAPTDSRAGSSREAGAILGIAGLPSTATAPASLVLFGAVLALAGLVLLRQSHRKN